MMSVIAIVQARMGSTRLPGKVLKEIAGKPVLWHIVNRLRHARLVDRVVIAVPDTEADNPVVRFAQENDIDYYAGNEMDLLDRIYQAARKFQADVVIWITADCPLIDPKVVDSVLRDFLDNREKYDIFSTGKPLQKRPIPDGLDTVAFSFTFLEKIWREVKDPFWREWFVASFSEQPEKYRYGTLSGGPDLSHLRWTLDNEDDLKFITAIYGELYRENEVFEMEDILAILRAKPEIVPLNS